MDSKKVSEITNDVITLLNAGKSIEEVSKTILNLHGITLNDARFLVLLAGLSEKFGVELVK